MCLLRWNQSSQQPSHMKKPMNTTAKVEAAAIYCCVQKLPRPPATAASRSTEESSVYFTTAGVWTPFLSSSSGVSSPERKATDASSIVALGIFIAFVMLRGAPRRRTGASRTCTNPIRGNPARGGLVTSPQRRRSREQTRANESERRHRASTLVRLVRTV